MSEPTIVERFRHLGLWVYPPTVGPDEPRMRRRIIRMTGEAPIALMSEREANAFLDHLEDILLDIRRDALLIAEDVGMGYERLDELDDILRRAIEKATGYKPPSYYGDDEDDGQPTDLQEHADFAQDGEFENLSAADIL